MGNHLKVLMMIIILLFLSIGCDQESVNSGSEEPVVNENFWTKTIQKNQSVYIGDAIAAQGGGYFCVGATNLELAGNDSGDVYLVKINSNGDVIWEKTYGGNSAEWGQSIVQLDDGTLLIAGRKHVGDANGYNTYLLKLDAAGNVLWSKTHGGALDEFGGQIFELPDGTFVIAGNIVDPDDIVVDNPGTAGYAGARGRSNIHILKVDEEGEKIWSKTFESDDNVLYASGTRTENGGFLLLASILYFPVYDDDLLLMKIDGDGNEVWTQKYEDGKQFGRDIVTTSDGNFLICAGFTSLANGSNNKADFMFMKLNSNGDVIWTNSFGDSNMIDYGSVLTETNEGSFVTFGERTLDHFTQDTDLVLVKIDANGDLVWEQSVTAQHTILAKIFNHPDGGYFIVGSAYTDPFFNTILIKTDEEGNME